MMPIMVGAIDIDDMKMKEVSALAKEKLLPASTLNKLRSGDTTITVVSLNAICDMLECQPGDLLEWYKPEV